ncbi:MAG: sulfite exporter TauE/SafE family protein [Nitrospirota bacterium]
MSEIEFLTVLGLGFLLGARHALDADHVAAVSTILSDRPNLRASGFIGFCWGFGHTAVLLLVGIAVIVLKITIPERVAVALEFGVGVMLVALGVSLVVTIFRERWHLHTHRHDGETHVHLHRHSQRSDHTHGHWLRLSLKPFAVGMMHGLAGSAALMLMVLSTVRTVWEGVAYILVFGLGSIVGMMLLGVVISLPIVLSASFGRRAQEVVQGLASLGSIGLGLTMMVRIGLGDGLF